MAEFDDPSPSDSQLIGSARRVGLAVDSCALLTRGFLANNRVAVAPMRINVGDFALEDRSDLDYGELYRKIAENPDTNAWTAAPKPEVWFEAIKQASEDVESVICLTVAAGLSASYDSAMVAAKLAVETARRSDVRVFDSGTIPGALKLMAMDVTRAVDLGEDADSVGSIIEETKVALRTVATIDSLERMHLIARIPRTALAMARGLSIKPVVAYTPDGFRLVSTPLTSRAAQRRMLRTISEDVGEQPTKFIVLHADAFDRAVEISMQIRERFDCQFMNVADFHPFVGFYAGRGAIGIAWERD